MNRITPTLLVCHLETSLRASKLGHLVPLSLLMLALVSCGDSGAAQGPSAVLITLDTTNALALDLYGEDRGITPNLSAFGRECVVYDRARTVAPITVTAHASMLTGLYPLRHTVRDNGYLPLPASARTVAEIAQSAGLRTAAFVAASVLSSTFGLDQGFEIYDDAVHDSRLTGAVGDRRGDEITDQVVRWLDERSGREPFFLWAHYFDPHAPYEPSAEFLAQAGNRPYLGEIAGLDAAVGRLLERLRREPDYDEMTIIVVADHGEGGGRHGEQSHALLVYDSTLHVPLLVRHPRGRRAGERSDEIVSVVDVFPTLLNGLELEGPAADGWDLFAEPVPTDRGVYFESYYGFLNYGWSPLAGWADAQGKYIHGAQPQYFETLNDPDETRDRFVDGDPAILRAREAIERLAQASTLPRSAAELRVATSESLQAMGYAGVGDVDAPVPHPLESTGLPAPRSRLGEHYETWEALGLSDAGQLEQAIQKLRAVTRANPKNVLAHDRLGELLLRARRPRKALVPLLAMIEQGHEHLNLHIQLAHAYGMLEEFDRALAHLARYEELFPGDDRIRGMRSDVERAQRGAQSNGPPR